MSKTKGLDEYNDQEEEDTRLPGKLGNYFVRVGALNKKRQTINASYKTQLSSFQKDVDSFQESLSQDTQTVVWAIRAVEVGAEGAYRLVAIFSTMEEARKVLPIGNEDVAVYAERGDDDDLFEKFAFECVGMPVCKIPVEIFGRIDQGPSARWKAYLDKLERIPAETRKKRRIAFLVSDDEEEEEERGEGEEVEKEEEEEEEEEKDSFIDDD